jgi:hypothetical protein
MMRSIFVVVGLAMALGGCAAEEQRAKEEKAYSATRLSGKFRANDPIVQMLSPNEQQAMANQGLLEESEPELGPDGEPIDDQLADGKPEKSDMDKVGDAMMSVLTVSVTLGMMAAPYLLF